MRKRFCDVIRQFQEWIVPHWVEVCKFSLVTVLTLFLLDYFDLPSSVIASLQYRLIIPVLAILFLIILAWLFEIHFFDLLKSPVFNELDYIYTSLASGLLIYNIGHIAVRSYFGRHNWKCTICFGSMIVALFCIFCCCRRFKKCHSTKTENVYGNVSLKEICEANISIPSSQPVYVLDKPVDYDLIGADSSISQLLRTITTYRSDRCFVIGLEGDWGNGKTTILNNVKKRLKEMPEGAQKYVVVDNFDPWVCGNEDAVLHMLYSAILKGLGIRIDTQRQQKVLSSVMQCLTNYATSNSFSGKLAQSTFGILTPNFDSIKSIRSVLSEYIFKSNKTVTVFIDNLDRASNSNIIFLFKLMHSVFDIPGIIYVVAYEATRINKIFGETNEVDHHFIEKIVQQRIQVPPYTDNAKQLFITCCNNLFFHYGVKRSDLEQYEPAIKLISEKCSSIREFIRFINSVYTVVFCEENLLDKADLFSLEVIHFFDCELYNMLRDNEIYLVSYDLPPNESFKIGFAPEQKNQKTKEVINSIIEAKGVYRELLSAIFPNVKKAMNNEEIYSRYPDRKTSFSAKRRSRMCSAQYFSLYFHHGSNIYLNIQELIHILVNNLNRTNSQSEAQKFIRDFIEVIKAISSVECLEHLEYFLGELNKHSQAILAEELFNSIQLLDTSHVFLGLNAYQRCSVIIAKLICTEPDDMFRNFVGNLQHRFDSIGLISDIIYWLKSDSFTSEYENSSERLSILSNLYDQICSEVVESKINLFDSTHYHHQNFLGIWRKYENDHAALSEYFECVLNQHTVYRILADIIGTGVGREYSYSLKKGILYDLGINEKNVLTAIQMAPPQNDSEELLHSVFYKYVQNEFDTLGRAVITTDMPITLNLENILCRYTIEALVTE